MMNGLQSIRNERASLEMNRVIIGSMIESADVNEAIESTNPNFFEGVSDEEIESLIDKIPESDSEDEQIERILDSEEDLDVDDILGIDGPKVPEEFDEE